MAEIRVERHMVQGKPLRCPHCENEEFWTRNTLMNTKGITFFGLEWANKTAQNYVCDRCGHVLWFLDKP